MQSVNNQNSLIPLLPLTFNDQNVSLKLPEIRLHQFVSLRLENHTPQPAEGMICGKFEVGSSEGDSLTLKNLKLVSAKENATDWEMDKKVSLIRQVVTEKTSSPVATPRPQPHSQPLPANMDSEFYKLVGVEKSGSGNIYKYKFIGDTIHFQKSMVSNALWISENQKVYPAIEARPVHLIELLDEYSFFSRLGYGYEYDERNPSETVFLFPDSKVIVERWEKILRQEKDLPNLKISDSKGIASDKDFIRSFFEYDVLLSDGKEFIHDHTAHVIETLIAMYHFPKDRYKAAREGTVLFLKAIFNAIMESSSLYRKEMLAILSFHVDTISNKLSSETTISLILIDMPHFTGTFRSKRMRERSEFARYFLNREDFKGKWSSGKTSEEVDRLGEELCKEWAKIFDNPIVKIGLELLGQ